MHHWFESDTMRRILIDARLSIRGDEWSKRVFHHSFFFWMDICFALQQSEASK